MIGVIIGIIQSSTWFALHQAGWPYESLVLIILGIGFWITGGLHLDGLIDTADGLGAGKEKCLEAMQDSRIGASGIQALLLVLFIQLAALLKLNSFAIFVFPIAGFWGRVSPLLAIGHFPYLHKNGSSAFHQINWRGDWEEIKPSLIIIFLASFLIFLFPINIDNHLSLLFCIWIGIIPTFLVPLILGNKLGGHSGDSYGAIVILVETFIIFLLAIVVQAI